MAAGRALFEETDAAGADFVNGAGQLHAAFGLSCAAFGRFEDLTHGPADVGLDGERHLLLDGEMGIEGRESRQKDVDQALNAGSLGGPLIAALERGLDCAASLMPEDDE